VNETSEIDVGTNIDDRYLLQKVLGVGGVGVVYEALDQKLNRTVALKLLKAELADHETLRPRFEREAETLASLMHPNLVLVMDYGLHEGAPYLTMELLSGRSLHEALAAGPLPEARVQSIVLQLLQGLAYAHGRGIVHRDIKPANIFLHDLPGMGEQVKILDFGFAKILAPEPGSRAATGPALTTAGTAFGTPTYMAPEQITVADMDVRTDIYAVGVVLFEMLAGKTPFTGEMSDLLRQHLVQPVPTLAQQNPEVEGSPGIEAVLHRALEKRPDDRYPGAMALTEVLQALPNPWMKRERKAAAATPGDAHAATMMLDSTDLGAPTSALSAAQRQAAAEAATMMLDSADLGAAGSALINAPARRVPDPSVVDMGALAALTGGSRPLPVPEVASDRPPAEPAGAGAGAGAGITPTAAAKPAAAAKPSAGPKPVASQLSEFVRIGRERVLPELRRASRRARPLMMRALNAVLDILGPLYERFRELARKKPALAYGALAVVLLLLALPFLLGGDDEPTPKPPAAEAPAESKVKAAEAAKKTKKAADDEELWASGDEPPELQAVMERLHKRGDLRPEDIETLRRLSAKHPDDARPHLLLAATYMKRGWRTDAFKQYQEALEADTRAKQDVHMLGDLIALAQGAKLNAKASATIAKYYGQQALPALDKALEKADAGSQAKARLERLRERLAKDG